MLKNIGGNNEWLKYLTLYSLYDANAIVTGELELIAICLPFAAITVVLYSLGVIVFSRRNLYL
jgi:ABC-2 type transport system permease protein